MPWCHHSTLQDSDSRPQRSYNVSMYQVGVVGPSLLQVRGAYEIKLSSIGKSAPIAARISWARLAEDQLYATRDV